MQTGAKRLVAVKALISDVHAGEQVSDPSGPTGILLPNKVVAHRLNLLGTVVSEPEVSESDAAVVIDDGTGSLVIRTFDQPKKMVGLVVGSVITVIGSPRPASDGMFIAPEIIKKTSPEWMAVRKKEIEILGARKIEQPRITEPQTSRVPLPNRLGAEEEIVIEEAVEASPERKIVELIKRHDSGDGAEAALVVAGSGIANTDAIIEKLLKSGDIFAVGPGRYKALE